MHRARFNVSLDHPDAGVAATASNDVDDMTEHQRFEYDGSLLDACASTAAVVLSQDPPSNGTVPRACWKLFEQHARHYQRQADRRSMQRFVESVLLVHRHNNNQRRRSLSHKIGLNQFSDVPPPPPPPPPPLLSAPVEEEWNKLWNNEDWETQVMGEVSLVRLHDEESVRNAFIHMNPSHYEHAARRLRRNNKRREHKHKTFVSVFDSNFSSLKIASDNDFMGDETTTMAAHHRKHMHNIVGDSFQSYLNWATDENPDGVPIVHNAHDQGACGSCWAFSATGTVEASASRRIAFQAYTQVFREAAADPHMYGGDEEDPTNLHERAVGVAQEAERNAIQAADLSVQELVDCDTMADQGCTGGNPLLAFYFIHHFGLTSTELYPYMGGQERCKMELVAKPIASVQSWGILTSNHEENMERVLRHLGPIAVGVNGADPTFLAYSGGIFDSADCEQGANHALLIVGHGQETNVNGTTTKYWIARNSWGEGWGEGGYVRVKRGSGAKGEEGVCGIARTPSVALGGVLLPESGITTPGFATDVDHSERMETSLVYNRCDSIGLGSVRLCNRVEGFLDAHRAIFYFLMSSFVLGMLMVFPITKDCREVRRQRRQQRRRQDAQRKQSLENGNPNSGEASSLLRLDHPPETYGSRF